MEIAQTICIYGAMGQWKVEQFNMAAQVWYACREIGGKLQALYVLRWDTRNLKKLIKIWAVIAVCTYTAEHDRVNSLLVHWLVIVLYSECASECEKCKVTGNQVFVTTGT